MITKIFRPSEYLKDCITQFWLWECDSPLAIPDIFPGTGVEMLFNLGDTLEIESPQIGRIEPFSGILICPRKSRFRLIATGKTKIVSVRFRSSGFFKVFGIPLTEIADHIIDVSDVFSVENSFFTAGCDSEWLDVIEARLLEKLSASSHLFHDMEWAIDKIYYQRSSHIVRDVKQRVGVSERTFQRQFKMITGVDAKYFERTARFQSCLRHLLNQPIVDYQDTIFMNGYYDQSHFIRDFNAFTGSTPSKFLTEKSYHLNHYS